MKRASLAASGAFRPSRSKGQCFLRDTQVIDRIVEAIAPRPDETILEIGAGSGQLTLPLLRAGAHLVSVEADPRLATVLREAARGELGSRLDLVEEDALRIDFEKLLAEKGLEPVRACGNLPYSVAAPILLRLLGVSFLFTEFTFMFQDEVAARLTARPGTKAFGVLSVLAQQRAAVRTLFRIPPQAFRPRPRVVSALVRFDLFSEEARPDVGDDATFRAIVKGLLAHRRKTIANNVKHLKIQGLTSSNIQAALAELEIDPGRRAETLSVEDFAELSRLCSLAQSEHFLPTR